VYWLDSSADIDIKKASKCFAQHFSCGSSVTGEDEVVVQGDVYDDIIDLIQEKWPQARFCMPQYRVYGSAIAWTEASSLLFMHYVCSEYSQSLC